MKNKTLTFLMLEMTKRDGEIKSRGYANVSDQRARIGKYECDSPAPEFFSTKHSCREVTKERGGTATTDLLGWNLTKIMSP